MQVKTARKTNCLQVMGKYCSRYRGQFLTAVIYAFLIAALAAYGGGRLSSCVLGTVNDDLFDETVLVKTLADHFLSGQSLLSSNLMEFPLNKSFLITHKSYLHVILAAPWAWLCQWPTWWNLAVLTAIWLSAGAAAWGVAAISRSPWLGFISGLPFIYMPWIREMISWGRLPQLTVAPALVALTCLAMLLYNRPHPKRWAAALALFTIVTALVYWIWGGLLALCGLVALVWQQGHLQKSSRQALTGAVIGVSAVILPLAFYVVSLDESMPGLGPQNLPPAQELQKAVTRAWHHGLGGSLETRFVIFPAAQTLPVLIFVSALFLVLLNRRKSTPLASERPGLWLWLAFWLILLGIGPYWSWGNYVLCDRQNRPLGAPFLYMMQWTGLGSYWQMPQTVAPLAMFCLCTAAALAWRSWKNQGSATCKAGLSALFCGLLALLFSLNGINHVAPTTLYPTGNGYWPRFAVTTPAWCLALKKLPPGAIIEMPLGFCCNTWQTLPLHNHPTSHGKRPVPWILTQNAFIQELFTYNALCAAPYQPQELPNNGASEVLFGDYRLPANYQTLSELQTFQAPPHEKNTIRRDYQKFYQSGGRYIVIHRAACHWLLPQQGDYVFDNMCRLITSEFGKPIFSDQQAAIFALKKPQSFRP